jgi:hypothetical protein
MMSGIVTVGLATSAEAVAPDVNAATAMTAVTEAKTRFFI